MIKKAGEIPYSWELIEDQIKDAIIAQAAMLSMYGPCLHQSNSKVDEIYLGIDFAELETADDLSDESRAKIDIRRHNLYHIARDAYIYAYQLDGVEELCFPVETHMDRWGEVEYLLMCFPQSKWEGDPTPFSKTEEMPLRRMLETFYARMLLFEGDHNLNIHQLSLLANMTVPAVRTSLSKEGFKLEKVNQKPEDKHDPKTFLLNASSAKAWLTRRRGFIPQRPTGETRDKSEMASTVLGEEDIDFPAKVASLISLTELKTDQIASEAGVDREWLKNLLGGKPTKLDIDALRSLAKALSVPLPDFIGMAVRHILSLETTDA